MIRKSLLAVTFVATLIVAGFCSADSAEAGGLRHGGTIMVARPVNATYYYYNGPTKAFFGPRIGIHSNAYDIGPYGPGYGWPYTGPVGYRFYVTF